MKEESNTFIVAASSLDYNNLTVCNGNVLSIGSIPIESVEGAVDRFQLEAASRKKDIEDLKFFTKKSEEAICQSFDSNIDLIKKELKKEVEFLKTYADVNYDAAVTRSITTCRREFDEKLNVIKNQIYIYMSIFGSLTLFLLFGFIYCMMFK